MMSTTSEPSASARGTLYALAPKPSAELTRRALDREGLLDVARKAHVASDDQIALPLSASAISAAGGADTLMWSGGVLPVATLAPPPGRRDVRGERSSMRALVQRALQLGGCTAEQLGALLSDEALPSRWEKLGDVVLFAPRGMLDGSTPAATALGALDAPARDALWAALAQAVGARRLGVQGEVEESLHRKSTARLLWPEAGASGWTVVRENGVRYGLDVTRSMFASGNGSEKRRVASFDCRGQTVVDLYAGIGYFTLPYLVHAGAAHVHACEWDDDALSALRANLLDNGVSDRCTVHAGDNASASTAAAIRRVAHRVNLGLIPSCEAGLPVAVRALRDEGGVLHVHANVGSAETERAEWCAALERRLAELAREAGRGADGGAWVARVDHLERVKSYAPRVWHVVADVRLAPASSI